ncbi:MAG TPA: TolC family protein [Kofleriaceae bacterium]|nr:TolC family protein [Kofleriaceae bacterium]
MRSLVVVLAIALARPALADDSKLSLADAVALARGHGYDVLLADGARLGAEGDLMTARAPQNPGVLLGWMHMWNYYPHDDPILGPCIQCANDGPTFQFMDNGAIENELSGKRKLRTQVAEWALRAAKMGKVDAQRNLEFLVKQQYVQVLQARKTVAFLRDVQTFSTKMYEINKDRYPKVINEGALARTESDKLQADANVIAAEGAARQAEAGLRYLLAMTGDDKPLVLDEDVLTFRVPAMLATPRLDDLVRLAIEHRPDLKGMDYEQRGATDALVLEKRLVSPDISFGFNWLSAGYAQNTAAPPQLTVQMVFTLPIFDQHQGRIRKAESAVRQSKALYDKTAATVETDVKTALAAFESSRDLVKLMEDRQLAAARTARDITQTQYQAGAAQLTDYLDAERTFVAVNQAYFQALAAYWTAVFQLEQAVGTNLREAAP